MFEQDYRLRLDHDDRLDDCWNRIGICGDRSCERLAEHVHCHNCPLYAAAAVRLLDRYALESVEGMPLRESAEASAQDLGEAHLVFRLGEEWLALRTLALAEVVPLGPLHSLPHRRTPALLGVANVRGTLVACLSLAELLGLPASVAEPGSGRHGPRLLILAAEGGPLVAPVDEVDGIYPLLPERTGASGLTHALLHWRGRSLRVLDPVALLELAVRSLA